MRLVLNISYEVEEEDPEAQSILEDIINQEAQEFANTVRSRLVAEGVVIHDMSVKNNP
jgi:hypothetical protein